MSSTLIPSLDTIREITKESRKIKDSMNNRDRYVERVELLNKILEEIKRASCSGFYSVVMKIDPTTNPGIILDLITIFRYFGFTVTADVFWYWTTSNKDLTIDWS